MSTTTPIYCRFKSDVHYRMVPLFVPRFDPTCPIVRRARLHGNISLAKLQQRCRILAAYLRHTCGILVAYLCHTCGILAAYLRHTCAILAAYLRHSCVATMHCNYAATIQQQFYVRSAQLCTATMPQPYIDIALQPCKIARLLQPSCNFAATKCAVWDMEYRP